MALLSTNGRGVFQASREVHLEFDSDETVDHFRTPWWSEIHEAVDDHRAPGVLYGQPAIATGLLGIDWVHSPTLESHPVYALAVDYTYGDRTYADSSNWAFFVRNWGNEGLCSSENHPVDFPRSTYTFKLPWEPRAIGWSRIHTNIRTWWGGSAFGAPMPGQHVNIRPVPGQGVYVTFSLPRPELHPIYEGEIDVKWKFGAGGPGSQQPLPVQPCAIEPGGCAETDAPERAADELLGKVLSEAQKTAIGAMLKEADTPDRRLARGALRLRRAAHAPARPTVRPKTRATLDPEHAKRDELQRSLLCDALNGSIPNFPGVCFVPATAITFDDQSEGATISNQYAGRGVTFGPTTSPEAQAPQIANAGAQANSGTNVLRIGRCFSPSCEFGMQSLLGGTFTTPHRRLGMFVGTSSPVSSTVTLRAYDASNKLVGQTQASLTPGSGFHTVLLFDSGSANITRFVVSAPTEISADDFAFS